MGIELRYTCLNCKPSQSTRLPPGVSGTSRTSGNLASDRPDWVVLIRWMSAIWAAAGPFPTRWNSRRQRHEDLVQESRSRYYALQMHRMT